MFIKLKNNYNNFICIDINEIRNANVIIEDLTDEVICYYVEVFTKSKEIFKTDTVRGEIDDYMKCLKREDIQEILTATLCYVLNDTDDAELNRLKIASLATAIYLITDTVGKQLASDMGI